MEKLIRTLNQICLRLLLAALLTSCASQKAQPKAESSGVEMGPELSAIAALAPDEPLSPLPVEADDARWGSDQAEVTLVAFLDFECPFCKAGYETLRSLREEYSQNELRIVFKHLPLRSHQNALPAAIAGQAVQLLGGSVAFERFADAAFQNQSALTFSDLFDYAKQSGVDPEEYNRVVSSQMTVERVAQDARTANSLGVDSTPAFYINGQLLSGAQPIEVFRQTIAEEFAHMKAKGNSRQAYQSRVKENLRGSLSEALLAQDPESYLVPVAGSPVRGPMDAPVTLVAFTDFECPFCKRAEVTLEALRHKYPEQLRIVFKHLPLDFHKKALPAARLSQAVQQIKGDPAFFAAADEIFARSPDLSEEALRSVGKKAGLSETQIRDALAGKNAAVEQRLAADLTLSDDVLARGTPHFFINGKRLSGARPVDHFEALVESQMLPAKELLSAGIAPKDVYEKLQEGALSPGAPVPLAEPANLPPGPSRGSPRAPVTVHLFSDFECPYCRKGEEMLSALEKSYPDTLRFVWHDFPLPFHERALPAARAAREAFHQKGDAGFWKMHDAIFNLAGAEARVTDDDLLAIGRELGLNEAALKDALRTEKHDAAIEKDITLADEYGIRGTPAFIIGDYLVTGVRPERHLARIVELVKAAHKK